MLKITLTVTPLETVVVARMDAEQTEQYEIYTETAGGLQMFESPLALDWYRYISSFYGYRINQETGVSELHRGLDLAVPVGTEVYAGNSGTVATGYDDHYGYYISITDEKGYVTKYAHLQSVDVTDGQKITKGDGIGKTGDSGSTAGSKLHIECMYDGNYYNPIFYFDTREGTLYGEPESPGGSTGINVGDGVPPASYDDATVQLLFDEGNKYLGMPYTFGGTPPESFDCSAFVCWVFTNSHVKTIPRTTAQALYEMSEPVTVSEAQAGDLIFFYSGKDADKTDLRSNHVGIVVEITDDEIVTVEGNHGPVGYHRYAKDDPTILGYGVLPDNPNAKPSFEKPAFVSPAAKRFPFARFDARFGKRGDAN